MYPDGIGSPTLWLKPPRIDVTKEPATSGARTANSVAPDALYAEFKDLGVEFGPAFRCLHKIERGEGFARAWIMLPENLEQTDGSGRAAPGTDRCRPSVVRFARAHAG